MARQIGGCGILLAAFGANVLIFEQIAGGAAVAAAGRGLVGRLLAGLAAAGAGDAGAGIRVGDGAATQFPAIEHLVAVRVVGGVIVG